MQNLVELDVSNDIKYETNHITNIGISSLAKSESIRYLKILHIKSNPSSSEPGRSQSASPEYRSSSLGA